MPAGVPRPGTTVMDKYVVEELLGVGGMGAVVRARRNWDGVRVAMKVMLAEEARHDDSTTRFFREARAAGVIDSPHVAKLLDFGRLEDGTPFMVLELLHGEGLDVIIKQRAPMAIEPAVDIILQAAEGIAEAHARGIVHRDVKPSNLFVTIATDGSPLLKVLDFGISKATLKLEQGTDAPSLTETNATLGSPQYMSPEQLKSSKDVDPRTDIWSLGLILYKMLTGRPAFEAPNVGAHFAMILSDPPTRLSKYRPDAPAALADAIATCLAKDCRERWQDLGQLARALVPFGSASARGRAEHITAILDYAGVSSSSHPRVSLALQPGDLTVRDAPLSKRSSDELAFGDPTLSHALPTLAHTPSPQSQRAGGAPEVGELTKSAWSPVTGRFGLPARRARRLLVAGGVVVLVGVAFGAGRMLQGEESRAAATAPASSRVAASSAPVATDNRKAEWLLKARAGSATADELRKLEALCVLEGDEVCIALATAPAAPSAKAPPVASSSAKAVEAEPRRSGPQPKTTAEPAPEPQPSAGPKFTPKGPMVDTL